ncbi:MAG: hypothetical protein FJY11_04685 [Bacteroidetes bacterium]|nr:hypothetical protein [Bacteroidota bacterium]
MCFSAGASFAGGAVISAIGAATLVKVRNPEQKLFASIPLLFGVQQISEGFVWAALNNLTTGPALDIPAYIFLVAAVVIWPTMIPLSVLKMEKPGWRRRAILVFLVAGIITSLYYGAGLTLHEVTPQIREHHILYTNTYPQPLSLPVFGLYAVATLLPLYFSSVRRMYIFGILVTISCLITGIFYREYLTSVWCFFAALISVTIFIIVSDTVSTRNPRH